MKKEHTKPSFLNHDFYRGFMYVISFGLIVLPAKKSPSYQRIRDQYLAMGCKGIAHDFQIILEDNAKCASAYNKKKDAEL